MKTILNLRAMAMVLTISFAFVNYSIAQSDWNTHGNIADSSSYIGTANYKDLRVKSDSITRMTISKDGNIEIYNNLNVDGIIKTDTLIGLHGILNSNSNIDAPNSWLHIDSIRANIIHVGDSSILIGNPAPGPFPTTANYIMSTNGLPICLGYNSSNTTSFSNIKVGIGTQAPVDKLHLYSSSSTPNYLLFTNGSNSTTATDGFEVGIMGNGSADLNLRKNAYLYTRTNNIIRTWLDPSGNFGIGLDPTRKLDVIDGAAPQLRLSQHTATFTNMPDVSTDFQTTSLGDLFINPTNATDLGFVGIGESAPSSKLEINDGTGGAQLELTFLGYKRTRFTTTTSGNLVIKPQAGAGVFGHTFIEGNTYTTGIPNFTLEDHGDFSVYNMDQAVTPPGVPLLLDFPLTTITTPSPCMVFSPASLFSLNSCL